MKKRNAAVLVILLALVIWGVYDYQAKKGYGEVSGGNGASGVQTGIEKGQKAPDFELQDLQGRKVKLSDYQGKMVLLNFWATWCPPCKLEMPHMEKFYQAFKQDGDLVVLAVDATTTERSVDNVVQFSKDYGLSFPVVLDAKGEVSDKYQITAFPTSYVIDAEGIIHGKVQGAMNYDMMKQLFGK